MKLRERKKQHYKLYKKRNRNEFMSKIVLHLPKRIQSPKKMKRNETDRIAMKEKKMNVFTHMEVRQLQKIKPDENFNAILKWKLYLSQRIKQKKIA